MSRYEDHESLKARTLHIKGVLPKDRTGEALERHLNYILKQRSFGMQEPGKVNSILVIPDMTKQLYLEASIRDLKDLNMLMTVQDPSCLDCFIPRKFRNPEIYAQIMEKYDNQLMNETMKPFINSGHAFVCFDSVTSQNTILKHFQVTPRQQIKIFYVSVKDKIFRFFSWLSGRDTSSQVSHN